MISKLIKKIRVGVVMGGRSIESEVSFNSGRTVCDHLDTQTYEIIPIFQTLQGCLYILPWKFLHRGKISDFVHRLEHEATRIIWDDLKKYVDFVYLAIHGRYAEDGTVQGFLEILNIPYLGSGVFASALSMNKTIQKQFLQQAGIDVAHGITVNPEIVDEAQKNLQVIIDLLEKEKVNLPWVVKPNNEGSSLGITIVSDKKDILEALVKASTIYKHKKQPVLIEEKIEGMEFSCITITDYITGKLVPLPATEVVVDSSKQFFDYEQKYMPGMATEHTPPRCAVEDRQKIQEACVNATRALDIKNISRIDGFLTKDGRVVIVDPNTLSGMGPASFLFREAAEVDMSHTDLINHLIKTELHSYGLLPKASNKKRNKEMDKKMRVAVLMGGRTNEKEISLESGRNVVYKLSPQKYNAIPLFVSGNMELFKLNQSLLVRNSTKEIESLVDKTQQVKWSDLPSIADFVFIGLHGGEGENGTVQGTLEILGLPYNGSSVLTSSLCMDKFKTNEFLRANGFDVPQSRLLKKDDWDVHKTTILKKIHDTITTFPMIVKPHDDGCSMMVYKVKNLNDLEAAVEDVFTHNKNCVLIEECIAGMELTVGVIGNEKPRAFPPSQAVVRSGILSIEEKFLPGAGENQTPAPLSPKTIAFVQNVIEKTYTAVACKGYSRIDCFYQNEQQSPTKKDRVVIIEVNTLPGLTPATCFFHQAAEIGLKPMDLIDQIIMFGLQEHKFDMVDEKKGKQKDFY